MPRREQHTRNIEEYRKFDPFHHALTQIDEEHRLIHEGMVWNVHGNELDVPDGETRTWTFRVGALPAHFKRVTIGASEGPVIITLTENPTITAIGTPADNVINLNRMSPTAPLTQVFNDTTFSDAGTPVLGNLYIPQQGNQGVTGNTGAVEEIVLASNTDYLFQVTNDPAGAGTADIFISLVFYEISYDDDGSIASP